MPILITGRFQRRFKNSDIEFSIVNVRLLEDVKGKLIHDITINLSRETINDTIHGLIQEALKSTTDNRGGLYFRIFDPEINRSVRLAAGVRIPINRKLVEDLQDLNIDFRINE